METQLLKLDPPYNIICDKWGRFALHIATLIVTTQGENLSDIEVRSYPVVGHGGFSLDGNVLTNSELKDCIFVCNTGQDVSLFTLKRIMEECAKKDLPRFQLMIPMSFHIAMMSNNVKLCLPKDDKGDIITDYEVPLVFEEHNESNRCVVYASEDSRFYFYNYFSMITENVQDDSSNLQIILEMAEQRDDYINIFYVEGVRKITFTTRDKKYKWFVDQLNNCNLDE